MKKFRFIYHVNFIGLALLSVLSLEACGDDIDVFSNTDSAPPPTDVSSNCSEISGGMGDPVIEISHIPPYGSLDDLEGQIRHVKPGDYKVAVYIYVSGWWTKPYWSRPLTDIQCDGTWICDVTTGGIDEKATKIVAYLVPIGFDPPLMFGGGTLPLELEENSIAKVETSRAP